MAPALLTAASTCKITLTNLAHLTLAEEPKNYRLLPMQVPVELKVKYLERKVQDMQILISSLDNNDFAPALKLGHQVKGNAETFDFPQMAPIGIKIENAAKNQDKECLRGLIEQMAQVINDARLTFH
jgi:hypothetical protein